MPSQQSVSHIKLDMGLFLQSVLILLVGVSSNLSDQVGLKSSPTAEDGKVIVCPGSTVYLTCIHENIRDRQTRWENLNSSQSSVIQHENNPNPNSNHFDPFNFSMVSNSSGPTLTSTIVATATEALNGTVVLCRAGGLSGDSEVGRVTMCVIGAPSPPVDISQIQQSNETILVNISCRGSFGTAVQFEASVLNRNDSVRIDNNIMMIHGLEYGQTYKVNITAISTRCPEGKRTSNVISVSLRTKSLTDWCHLLWLALILLVAGCAGCAGCAVFKKNYSSIKKKFSWIKEKLNGKKVEDKKKTEDPLEGFRVVPPQPPKLSSSHSPTRRNKRSL